MSWNNYLIDNSFNIFSVVIQKFEIENWYELNAYVEMIKFYIIFKCFVICFQFQSEPC